MILLIGEVSGRWLSHEDSSVMNGIRDLMKRVGESLLSFCHMRMQFEGTIYMSPHQTLILDFPTSRTVAMNSDFHKLSSLSIHFTVSWIDSDNQSTQLCLPHCFYLYISINSGNKRNYIFPLWIPSCQQRTWHSLGLNKDLWTDSLKVRWNVSWLLSPDPSASNIPDILVKLNKYLLKDQKEV